MRSSLVWLGESEAAPFANQLADLPNPKNTWGVKNVILVTSSHSNSLLKGWDRYYVLAGNKLQETQPKQTIRKHPTKNDKNNSESNDRDSIEGKNVRT